MGTQRTNKSFLDKEEGIITSGGVYKGLGGIRLFIHSLNIY